MVLSREMKKKKFVEVVARYPVFSNFREKENFYLWPAKLMIEKGYDVEFLTLIDKRNKYAIKKEEVVAGIKVKRFKNTSALLSYIKKDKSIELVFSLLRPYLPCLFSGVVGKKSILTPLTYIVGSNKIIEKVSLFFMNRFDKIIALTPYERDVYLKKGISKDKVVWLPFSVDYDYFSKKVVFSEMNFRKKYGIRAEDFIILSVANMRQFKNVDIIIKAFSIFHEKVKNSKLVIVGGDFLSSKIHREQRKGPSSMKEIVDKLGLRGEVILTGDVDVSEVRKFLNISDVFVNSSEPEAQGIAVYEAAAAGLPLCLSNIGSFTSVFKELALYNKPRDSEGLVQNYLTYYNDKKLREKNGRFLRMFVKDWDYNVNKKKMEKLFDGLLG